MARAKKQSFFGDGLKGAMEELFGGNTDHEDDLSKEALDKGTAEWDKLGAPYFAPQDFDNQEWLGDFEPTAMVEAPTFDVGDDVSYEGVDARLADLDLVDGTKMTDISVDPRLKDRQMASLSSLDEIIAGGGMTAMDEANLNRVQGEVSSADRGRRDAIKQNMAARGMGGSGMELLAQLQSSQAATDRANQSGLDIAGMSQQRALDSIMQGGNLAGNMRGQEFGEQAQVAQAQDAIAKFNSGNTNQMNQFNAGAQNNMGQFNAGNQLQTSMFNKDNQLQVGMFNTGNQFDATKTNAATTNQAGLYNHQGKQGTANANVDINNKNKIHNNYTIPQTGFENAAKVTQGKAGQADKESAYWDNQAKQEAAGAAGVMGAVGSVAAMASDKRVKKNIKPLDDGEIQEFLQAVKPKSFEYKNPDSPGQAEGSRVGFLLQDVQGTKAGKALTQKQPDGTLAYDKDNMDGLLLAALSSMAKGKKAS